MKIEKIEPKKRQLRSFTVRLPILAYHSLLHDSASQLPPGWVPLETISYSRFCTQLDAFIADGWRNFPPSRLMDLGAWSLSERNIMFTFDDGHNSDLLAAEALKERGFTGIFFIPWSNIGRSHFLTRRDIKLLCRNGLAIGSHGLTHSRLTYLSGDLLRTELVESKARLEDLVGQPVQDLAPPFGRYNRRVIEAALDAGYTAVMTSKIGLASPTYGSRIFPRIPVKPSMTDSLVCGLINGSPLARLRCRFRGSILRRARSILHHAPMLAKSSD